MLESVANYEHEFNINAPKTLSARTHLFASKNSPLYYCFYLLIPLFSLSFFLYLSLCEERFALQGNTGASAEQKRGAQRLVPKALCTGLKAVIRV